MYIYIYIYIYVHNHRLRCKIFLYSLVYFRVTVGHAVRGGEKWLMSIGYLLERQIWIFHLISNQFTKLVAKFVAWVPSKMF